jgi:hypothetical protein
MINSDKWIKTLTKTNTTNQDKYELDSQVWINTIPNQNPKKSFLKYSFVSILFITSLTLVMFVKNETRNLEKDLINLKASINKLKFNVHYGVLDYNVLSSPENISILAKQHLDLNLINYKKLQIQKIGEKEKKLTLLKDNNNYTDNVRKHLVKTYYLKKNKIEEIKDVYTKPKELSYYIKSKTKEKIKNSKEQLKAVYDNPDILISKKAQRWAAFQVVKAFLGIPVLPGR